MKSKNFVKKYSYSKTSLWDTLWTFPISPSFLSEEPMLLPWLSAKSSPQQPNMTEQTLNLHLKNTELYSNQDVNTGGKVPEDMYP